MTIDAAARGRTELIVIVGTAALIHLLITLGAYLRSDEIQWLSAIGRPAVMIGLGIFAAARQRWARNLLAAWVALTGIVFMIASIPAFSVKTSAGLILFAVGGAMAALAFRLQTSQRIETFFAAKRTSAPAL